MTPLLQFPSETKIIEYLTSWLIEKGFIGAIAKAFADTKKAELGITIEVQLVIFDLNQTLNFPAPILIAMQMNFIGALIACAKGKEITTKTIVETSQVKNDAVPAK